MGTQESVVLSTQVTSELRDQSQQLKATIAEALCRLSSLLHNILGIKTRQRLPQANLAWCSGKVWAMFFSESVRGLKDKNRQKPNNTEQQPVTPGPPVPSVMQAGCGWALTNPPLPQRPGPVLLCPLRPSYHSDRVCLKAGSTGWTSSGPTTLAPWRPKPPRQRI